jgi:hypothetical protein
MSAWVAGRRAVSASRCLYVRMITYSPPSEIILGMTPLRKTPRLHLVTDRRVPGVASATSPVRRFRLARLQSGQRQPAVLPARKPASPLS